MGGIQLRDANEVSDFEQGACIEIRLPKEGTAQDQSDEDRDGKEPDHNSGLALPNNRNGETEV